MSNDVRCSKMLLFSRVFEGLAAVHIQEVTGSSPVVPTTLNLKRTTLSVSRFRFFFLPLCFKARF